MTEDNTVKEETKQYNMFNSSNQENLEQYFQQYNNIYQNDNQIQQQNIQQPILGNDQNTNSIIEPLKELSLNNKNHQPIQENVNEVQDKNQSLLQCLQDIDIEDQAQIQKAIDNIQEKINNKVQQLLQKSHEQFGIQYEHISLVADTYAFLWADRIQKSQDLKEEYHKMTQNVDTNLNNFEIFSKQLKEILKSPIECDNKIISCNFSGTYHQYMDHIFNHCKYEFDQGSNVLRICQDQKQFSDEQIEFFQNHTNQQKQQQEVVYQQDQFDELLNKVPTLLVANFPQVGMVELFRKFGEIDKFHFDNKNNLIFYVTYKDKHSQMMAMQQLSQVEIQGKRLRVTEFIDKETLKKCRLFVKGLQNNNELYIKSQLEYMVGLPITQVSLMNQKNQQHDASAFIQFQAQDMQKAQKLIDNIYTDTPIGKRIQIKSYRPRQQNHFYHYGNNQNNNNNNHNSGNKVYQKKLK